MASLSYSVSLRSAYDSQGPVSKKFKKLKINKNNLLILDMSSSITLNPQAKFRAITR